MTTTLLIITTILLALAGLAIMTLTNRLENAEAIRVKYVIQINNLARAVEAAKEAQYKTEEKLNELQLDAYTTEQVLKNALEDAEMAFEQELKTKLAKLKIGYENRCIELEEELKGLNRELEHTIANSDSRDQALSKALEDAETAAKDNEWLYNVTLKDLHEACKVLEELQEEHKNTIEGYEYQTELQARKIAKQADHIIKLEAERGGMSRHQLKLHQQITKLEKELEAYYTAEAELTEAIEAAEEASTESEEEEASIHIDEKKGWICIGEWARLIVYKHNIYQPYVQNGLGAKIERTKRSDLTVKAQDRYNALKAALKN